MNNKQLKMQSFNVPSKDEVTAQNRVIFANRQQKVGFVPNLYATYAYNDTALGDYLHFQGLKSSLLAKEKEAINLVVSEINGCHYCQSAHTTLAKMNGFTHD